MDKKERNKLKAKYSQKREGTGNFLDLEKTARGENLVPGQSHNSEPGLITSLLSPIVAIIFGADKMISPIISIFFRILFWIFWGTVFYLIFSACMS